MKSRPKKLSDYDLRKLFAKGMRSGDLREWSLAVIARPTVKKGGTSERRNKR